LSLLSARPVSSLTGPVGGADLGVGDLVVQQYSWVVSVLAWPRRRRTVSMDTPELKLGGVDVAQLVDADADADPGRAAVALPAVVGGIGGTSNRKRSHDDAVRHAEG
jgi:hypothetical protein